MEKLASFQNVDEGVFDIDLDLPAQSYERTITNKSGLLTYAISLIFYVAVLEVHFMVEVTPPKYAQENESVTSGTNIPWEYWPEYLASFLNSLGLSTSLLYLLGRFPARTLWIIIFSSCTVIYMIAGLSFKTLPPEDTPDGYFIHNFQFIAGFALSIFAVFNMIFLPHTLKKSVSIVAPLHGNCAKALVRMFGLLLPSLIVTIVQVMILGSAAATIAPMLIVMIEHQTTCLTILTVVTTLFMTLWTLQIISGLHIMAIAGSVASLYSNDFVSVSTSVFDSFGHSVKFHVGTIVWGSLLVPVFTIARFFTAVFKICCELRDPEVFNVTNSLILTALHGQPFRKSLHRAFALLQANALAGIKRNSDYLLWLVQFNVLLVSSAISYTFFLKCDNRAVPVLICYTINIIVIAAFFVTLKITFNTVLFCLCEDRLIKKNASKSCDMMTILDDEKDKIFIADTNYMLHI